MCGTIEGWISRFLIKNKHVEAFLHEALFSQYSILLHLQYKLDNPKKDSKRNKKSNRQKNL